MKQKIDREPEEKESWWERVFNPLVVSDMKEVAVMLFLAIAALIAGIIGLGAEWNRYELQKTIKTVPTEQQQPIIEIPIERTVCVKPAEGYCMEYRTSRIRTP